MVGADGGDSTFALQGASRRPAEVRRQIVRDGAAAEDVVQEAWLRYSTRNGDAGEVRQPLGYLYRIVRNLALNWATRTARYAPQPVPPASMENVPDDVPSAEDVLYYRDELRVLAEAIAELPQRTQVAFRMYKLEGRTLQEVADCLGISVVRVHHLVKEAALHAARRLCGERD